MGQRYRITYLAIAILISSATQILADKPASLDEAKELATRTRKLILFEFHRYDCEYCELSAREQATDPAIKIALQTVVHFPVDVLSIEGVALAEEYRVGSSFPVFVVADKEGAPIARWTGFVDADRFIDSFNKAMAEQITIADRKARFETTPTLRDATKLKSYFSDTREYLEAIKYLRQMQALNEGKIDYSYPIFLASAEAVWSGLLPFDSLLEATFKVMEMRDRNLTRFGSMAQIMSKVARRTGRYDSLSEFLRSGILATQARTDDKGIELHRELIADYGLYVEHDTAGAMDIIKRHLGDGWESDPARCFQYASWCLERKLDLEAAEDYARRAVAKASEGKFKASHLKVLAEIVMARGRTEEAVQILRQAIEHDQNNTYYRDLLKKMESTTE